jgi:hypothetical protein
MWPLLIESTLVGFITWVIGTIVFNLSINKLNKDKEKPYGISLAFFMTGLILCIINYII